MPAIDPEELQATPEYAEKVIRTFFHDDGRLKQIPTQLKKRMVVLRRLVQAFERERVYTEREVNETLARFHETLQASAARWSRPASSYVTAANTHAPTRPNSPETCACCGELTARRFAGTVRKSVRVPGDRDAHGGRTAPGQDIVVLKAAGR